MAVIKSPEDFIAKDGNDNPINTIPAGLRADIMRCSMENKNLLQTKGAIYVGTGEVLQLGDGNDSDITVAKTEALDPGTNGYPLVSLGENGVGYQKLDPSGYIPYQQFSTQGYANMWNVSNSGVTIDSGHLYYIGFTYNDGNNNITMNSPVFYVNTTEAGFYVPVAADKTYSVSLEPFNNHIKLTVSDVSNTIDS